MAPSPVGTDEVVRLLAETAHEVLGVSGISGETRFAEDLQADSLDLLEIVEKAERTLRARGFVVEVPDTEVLAARNVREAAVGIAAHVRQPEAG